MKWLRVFRPHRLRSPRAALLALWALILLGVITAFASNVTIDGEISLDETTRASNVMDFAPPECQSLPLQQIYFPGQGGQPNGNLLVFLPDTGAQVSFKGGNRNATHCIVGGDGDDTITGSKGNDVILGGGGNDTIRGDQGDDDIYGGPGSDYLSGGHDNDRLYGGEGDDELDGDKGNADQANGGSGGETTGDTCVAESTVNCEH